VRFGPVFLPSDVRAGTWKMMEDKEVKSLSQMLELKPRRGAKMSVVEKQKFDRRYKKQRARRQEGD
jgi:23S rRNA pseudouridine2605 synthase